jgi:AcrR family transcriptional regulator
MSPPALTPLKQIRQERILDSATRLFVEQGFRAVTMTAIAEASGHSKVTLYGYFADKDAIFRAVARRFADQLQRSVFDELAADGPAHTCINRALLTKHRMVFDLVRRSAHAKELFAMNDQISEAMFESLDRSIEDRIAERLCKEGMDMALSHQLARLLFAASQGIANQAATLPQLEADLGLLTTRLLNA